MVDETIVKSPTFDSHDCTLQQLRAMIQERLKQHVYGFELTLVEGGLLIRGKTRTYYAKQMAQEVVMEVTDLHIISNSIQVTCTPVVKLGQ